MTGEAVTGGAVTGGDDLAATGASPGGAIGVALVLLLVGSAVLVLGRRSDRRRDGVVRTGPEGRREVPGERCD